MNVFAKFCSYASLVSLAACSTIVNGSTNNINVSTTPPSHASCTLANARESVTAYTPGTATVKKSKTDLNINCTDTTSGATGKTTLVSDVDAWDFGNILIGGIIGMGIDWGTGAAYKYPETANIPLSTPNVGYYPTPAGQPIPAVTTQPYVPYSAAAQPVAAPTYYPPGTSAAAPAYNPAAAAYRAPVYAPVQQPAAQQPQQAPLAPLPFGTPTPVTR